MPIIKGKEELTIAFNGSLIVPGKEMAERQQYIQQKFGLKPQPVSPVIVKKKESLATDIVPENEETAEERYRPKSNELIRVPFRAISMTIVAGGTWRATDFTKKGVLKASRSKLAFKPAYTDHFTWSDNHIGVVESATWSERATQGGITIPAGIDVVYLIDAQQNEKLARGLLMDPPSVYSNSVTVEFEYESSHEFDDENDFLRNLGNVIDEKMVARVPTNIIDYHESSIVWLGADPFAKMRDKDGNLINPELGGSFDEVTSYTKDLYTKSKKYFIAENFSKRPIYLKSSKQENPDKKSKMEKLLLEFFGVEKLEDITQEQIDAFKSFMNLAKTNAGLKEDQAFTKDSFSSVIVMKKDEDPKAEIDKLKKQITEKDTEIETLKKDSTGKDQLAKVEKERDDLKTKVTELETFSKIGKETLNQKRSETERLYKLHVGNGNEKEPVLALIKKANDEELDGMLAQYTKGVKEKFKAKCQDCGSEKFTFKSSLEKEEEDSGDPTTDKIDLIREMRR